MRITLLIICYVWLILIPAHIFGTTVNTVEELTEALTPKTSEEPVIRTRGFGGIKQQSQAPSVAMNLTFELNSAILTDDDLLLLNNLGKALEKDTLRGYVYQLEGHTCDLGTESYNQNLSRQRAEAVKKYLLKEYDLDDRQLKVAWFGESRPAVPNVDEEARKQNRRVVVINTTVPFDLPMESVQPIVMETKYLDGNNEITLENGDTLSTNQQYAVQFKTNDDLHVYVYQVDETGEMTNLYPNPEFGSFKNPVISGTFRRIPEEGKWFYLDDTVGSEQIILIASSKPIENHSSICRKIANETNLEEMIAQTDRTNVKTRGLGGVVYEQSQNLPNEKEKEAAHSEIEASSDQSPEIFIEQKYFYHR